MFRVGFASNDSYILEIQVGYNRILLIRVTYISVKWATSIRVLRLNSLKHFMNLPGYIQGRNEHNYKNKICTKKEISELDWILMCPIPFFFFFLVIFLWMKYMEHALIDKLKLSNLECTRVCYECLLSKQG